MHHFKCGCQKQFLGGCQFCDVLPAVVHEPMTYVKHNNFTHVVPHVHPVYETTVDTHVYKNQHYFPHNYNKKTCNLTEQSYHGNPNPTTFGC